MYPQRTSRLIQLVLCALAITALWFCTGILQLQVLALSLGALLSNIPPKDLFERCAAFPIDRVAWKDFLSRYNEEIEATIRRIVGYPPQGRYSYLFDDILQRFYHRLLENNRRALHALRGSEEAQARAYLRTIAAGITYKMIGHEPPHSTPLAPTENEGSEGGRLVKTSLPDSASWSAEAIVLLASMQTGLNRILRGRNKYRNMLIFKLATLDGFTPKEIARINCLHIKSRHAIEQLISRTRQKLRSYLKA